MTPLDVEQNLPYITVRRWGAGRYTVCLISWDTRQDSYQVESTLPLNYKTTRKAKTAGEKWAAEKGLQFK